jgi:alpha-ribazole phosphatase
MVARALGIPLRIDHRLREISFGDWEQKKWTNIEATMPEQFQSWMDHWLTEAPPQGELPAQLAQRVQSWWSDLATGDHLLVSHAGVQRALRMILRGMTWPEAMQQGVPYLKGELFHIDK